jgi:hypothetical protein
MDVPWSRSGWIRIMRYDNPAIFFEKIARSCTFPRAA